MHKKIALSDKTKNIILIVLAALLLTSVVGRAIAAGSASEVEAEYIDSQTIALTLRGRGTVTSNTSVEVLSEEACLVYSIPVQEGDEVSVGDVLVECSDYAAATAETLQAELDKMLLEYQTALIDQSNGAYSKEQNAVEKAQTELERAKSDCADNLVTDAELKAAKDKVSQSQKAIAVKEDEIARLEAAGATSDVTLEQAQAELQKLMLVHGDNYNIIVTRANNWMKLDGLTAEERAAQRNTYIDAVYQNLENELAALKKEIETVYDYETKEELQNQIDNFQSLVDAYKAISPAQKKLEAAQSSASLTAAKAELVTLNRQKTNADTELTELQAKRTAWQTANSSLEDKRKAVDTALDALATAQKEGQKADLKLTADKEKIDEKREELKALTNNGETVLLVSKVNGIIKSIAAGPGSAVEKGTALMTIEVPDMGYTVSFPVSRAQSALLSEGAVAYAVTDGDEPGITGVLQEIGAYTEDASKKLLTFALSGEAEAGAQLSLIISGDSKEYDRVIPSAALREDSSGSFVLTVTAKRGLFGTRYMLSRVPVEVLARDDRSVAVSGELNAGDMVVTTNPCTLGEGDYVSIPDSEINN